MSVCYVRKSSKTQKNDSENLNGNQIQLFFMVDFLNLTGEHKKKPDFRENPKNQSYLSDIGREACFFVFFNEGVVLHICVNMTRSDISVVTKCYFFVVKSAIHDIIKKKPVKQIIMQFIGRFL